MRSGRSLRSVNSNGVMSLNCTSLAPCPQAMLRQPGTWPIERIRVIGTGYDQIQGPIPGALTRRRLKARLSRVVAQLRDRIGGTIRRRLRAEKCGADQ